MASLCGHQVRDLSCAQNCQHRLLSADPNAVRNALLSTMARVARCETKIERDGSVDGFDHTQQRSCRATWKKGETAYSAPPGLDQSSASQGLKDLGKKAFRRFCHLGKKRVRNHSSFRLACQMNLYANSIVGGASKLHRIEII